MPDDPKRLAHTPTPTPPPSVWLSASSGPAGTELRVAGSGFDSDPVFITFNGQPVTAASLFGEGSFSTSFEVPALPPGVYSIVVGNLILPFTVTAPATVPACSEKENQLAKSDMTLAKQILDHLLAVQVLAKGLDVPRRALVSKGLVTIIEAVLRKREMAYKALPSANAANSKIESNDDANLSPAGDPVVI